MVSPGIQPPKGILDKIKENSDGAISLGGELKVVRGKKLGDKGRIFDEGALHNLTGIIIDEGNLEGVPVGDCSCQADQPQPEPCFFKYPMH